MKIVNSLIWVKQFEVALPLTKVVTGQASKEIVVAAYHVV
jgi:hypothetical protein